MLPQRNVVARAETRPSGAAGGAPGGSPQAPSGLGGAAGDTHA